MEYLYQVYNLGLRSILPLPELISGGSGTDIKLQLGKLTPPALSTTTIQRQGIEVLFGGSAREAYLRWPGIGTFLAQDGYNLTLDLDTEDINSQLLNLYILSESLGLILYQKGLFLLHASAIQVGSKVLIFAGSPGAGKSTTAAAFVLRGYPVLADDMVAIDLNSLNQPLVYPAFPQIKIWPQTLKGLGYDLATFPRLFPDSKKRVIRQLNNVPTTPLPLGDIFFLQPGANFTISKLKGIDAFFNLIRYFPLPGQLLTGNALEHHQQQCLRLLEQVGAWQIENPKNFKALEELVTWLNNKYLAK